jgi:DNA processing protein
VSTLSTLTPLDALYPPRLRHLSRPPEQITVSGALDAPFVVAIVGTREPTKDASDFAEALAAQVANAGAAVVSGGALGIDSAAHRGALAAGGATWCVAPTGHLHTFPTENAALFAEIGASAGAMVWPFPPDAKPSSPHFFARNRILVALSDVVVVVQAGAPSGALNAAAAARKLGRPLWVVPGSPWTRAFAGCLSEIDRGAHVLTSIDGFLGAVGLAAKRKPTRLRPRAWADEPASATDTLPLFAPPPEHEALWEAVSTEPRHVDEIAARARVCASTAATALLTLALENVVVEGPGGFYRRRNLG